METLGQCVVLVVVACAILGALASLRSEDSGLGREFLEGFRSIGPIFVPVAGIMAAVPYLAQLITAAIGPAFGAIGADPSIAATSVIAVDMGGYKLASELSGSLDSWIMAVVVGYMAGATIVFSIPVGLAMLAREDRPFLALGVMSGILSVPIGVLTSCAIIAVSRPAVAGIVPRYPDGASELALGWPGILQNLVPLVVFVVAIALGLRFAPKLMIAGFIAFGRLLDVAIKLVLVASIAEMTTTGFFGIADGGVLTAALGGWGFDPIIADSLDPVRALEVAGYIGMMLCGAFPMIYLVRKYLSSPISSVGRLLRMDAVGAAGLLASVANILAMFRLVRDMAPRDKVVNIAFAVCAAFLLGDHLAFTANFQPTLLLPILTGKLVGGLAAIGFAMWFTARTDFGDSSHSEAQSP